MMAENPYEDILHLPHHRASGRPHMSLYDRAAQFAPFAALSGFDGVIAETGRLTERRKELSEEDGERLNQRLAAIARALQRGEHPRVAVTCFVPDPRKPGGAYREHTGRVRRIDAVEKTIVFLAANGRSGGEIIRMADIAEIRGELPDPAGEDGA